MAKIQEGGDGLGHCGDKHRGRQWNPTWPGGSRQQGSGAAEHIQQVQMPQHRQCRGEAAPCPPPKSCSGGSLRAAETKGVRSKGGPEEKEAAAPEGGNHKGLMEGIARRSLDMHHNGTLAASSILGAEIC